ncbi:MAG: homoserine dehydrogenase [Chloroflexota bacterium]|nr:homoserine dehydrogenase [Chloroflexota bacterium]
MTYIGLWKRLWSELLSGEEFGVKGRINIGLIGLGVIGSGVARILAAKSDTITKQVGTPLMLSKAADLDKARKEQLPDPNIYTANAREILEDPEIDIVVELIGKETPAHDYIREAIQRKKHVVTANKEVMAKHGPELLPLAAEHKVGLRYEASVGGGIPLIAPLKRNLQVNDISAIHTIINGTTNYILTRMEKDGLEFSAALKEAQALGYAEADPTSDIEGFDAAYKIAILATIAFRTDVRPEDVYHEGISRLASQDFRYAKELGYAIKLLAIAKKEGVAVQARVHPAFVPNNMLLAKVDGVFNAVQIEGDLSDRVIFYGRGAGSEPTANVIVSDAIHLAQNINLSISEKSELPLDLPKLIKPMAEIETRCYIRMTIADQAGVLAQITKVLAENNISISSAIQKEVDNKSQTAEIVIMTHPAPEQAMQIAIGQIEQLEVVKEISNLVRVED